MTIHYVSWFGVAVVLAGGGMVFFNRGLRRRPYQARSNILSFRDTLMFQDSQSKLPEAKPTLPHAIVLGDDAQRHGVRIAPLSDEERYRTAQALPGDSMLISRLSAGLQAVPSLLVEEGHRGKRLMEVVINGDLVRAKDGVGLRAWTMDANNKISEHAKLFDADKLQTMVNAAAVWQVASVVVAQKHLADISAKLDEIRKGVQDVSDFLNEERRAKVTGTYEYLQLAVSAIKKGELSLAIRTELESCDRELIQIQHHLQRELLRQCEQPVEHKEMFGTGDLQKDTVTKYERLKGLAKDMRLTLKTRALAWYVLSLYPGEPALKQARMEGLLRSVEEVEAHLQTIEASAERDCQNFSSIWNNGTTLAIRKANVRDTAQALSDDLVTGAHEAKKDVQASDALLSTHDAPTYLVFEVEDGCIGELRVYAS
ncbi:MULTISPECIES: hypothetical protein [Burkholderia]|uniref:hypothetical protein n=1 Tax=Burkholderia TaxID=32008 RepID=UPI0022D88DE6|nr:MULTISPECIES: hypothetical protein [Burkholderia]MDA0576402.1 hypothetical protein [Burkholderia gladioli]MDA0604487.1 hypothetical protein [Burkholderia gladioli]MDN7815858.1 hypothetical protein [Burkholderia vietnamiensis]